MFMILKTPEAVVIILLVSIVGVVVSRQIDTRNLNTINFYTNITFIKICSTFVYLEYAPIIPSYLARK